MTLIIAMLPIALTMLCGYLLVAFKIVPRENWGGIETLSFRLLIPAVLILSISRSDLAQAINSRVILALLITLAIIGIAVLSLRFLFNPKKLPNQSLTTIFQTTTRWNVFVAFAAAEVFIGSNGLMLIAVIVAVLVPLINIANIIVLTSFGPSTTSFKGILKAVFKNPLVQACIIGIALNVLPFDLPDPLIKTLDLVGRAAFGVGLLVLGAGISVERLFKNSGWIWLGVSTRMLCLPVLFLMLASMLSLTQTQILAGIIALIVPAASNGYIIAKQMGGDAELYADILTWQTVLCVLALPLWVSFVT